MSLNALKWAIDQKTGKPLAQLLLITLADLDNSEYGYSWASHQYLADRCQCSRRTVMRSCEWLEAEGFVKIEHQTKDGIKSTNHYFLNYSRCDKMAQHDVTNSHKGSDKMSLGGSDKLSHKQLTSFNNLTTNLQGFDQFWSQYPKKVSKKDARKAWDKLSKAKDFDPEAIIADVMNRNQNDSVFMGDKQFIPNGATYLNGEKWDDEIIGKPKSQLTEDEKYGLRKQRNAAILQELNGGDVGVNGPSLPSPMDESEW